MMAKAEEARLEADALYSAYFENTPEALFVVGARPEDTFVVAATNARRARRNAGSKPRNRDL